MNYNTNYEAKYFQHKSYSLFTKIVLLIKQILRFFYVSFTVQGFSLIIPILTIKIIGL
jgi:hypothetical protein